MPYLQKFIRHIFSGLFTPLLDFILELLKHTQRRRKIHKLPENNLFQALGDRGRVNKEGEREKKKRGRTKARDLPFLALVLPRCFSRSRFFFWLVLILVPIPVPIALLASLSRRSLGTRIEGLWRHTVFQFECFWLAVWKQRNLICDTGAALLMN